MGCAAGDEEGGKVSQYPPTKCCATCAKWQRDTEVGNRHVCTDKRAGQVCGRPPVKEPHDGRACKWHDPPVEVQRRMFS